MSPVHLLSWYINRSSCYWYQTSLADATSVGKLPSTDVTNYREERNSRWGRIFFLPHHRSRIRFLRWNQLGKKNLQQRGRPHKCGIIQINLMPVFFDTDAETETETWTSRNESNFVTKTVQKWFQLLLRGVDVFDQMSMCLLWWFCD